ncbi:MAG: M20/M25/M40 family metallo-hydrolase, partial [Chloroflexota bacterium]|nr:M20/M25/M40 family metallo-hydrolase [Chloroflexota bacterium]
IGAIDEERESIGARHIVDKYQPDFAIIGEPSRWNRVTLGYKGGARAQVSVGCQIQHSAGPSQSAPEAAIEIWKRITTWVDKFNSGRERVFEQVSPTLSGFSSKIEDFEETATLQISTRLPLRLKPRQWYAELKKILIDSSPFKVSIKEIGFPIPAYKAGRNSPLVGAFLGGIRAEGSRPGFVVKTGTADLNIVAPVWGCPAVAYGPGDSSLDHRPNEHTSLVEYQQAVGVLINVLQKLVVVDD